MISVKWHKDHHGNWDHSLLMDILKDGRFMTEESEGCIYVVSGEYESAKDVNEAIKRYKWVIMIITSDEQSKFQIEKVKHPNSKIYIQYPKQGRHDKYGKWPLGYTPHTRPNLKLVDKDLDFFFSGQITHKRREDCYKAIKDKLGGKVYATPGFTQGMKPDIYINYMNRTKTAPAPAGPICADSFRCYEALEAGAIPIADNISLAGDHDYWNYLFGNVPFPTINYYHDLPGYIDDQLEGFQAKANKIQAWWIKQKRDLKHALINDVAELTGKRYNEALTVVIPVSPIKSHPDTKILDETISTIRTHLNTEIIITFDGVRPEQEDRRRDYEEFIRRALFKCNTEWSAVPIIFDEHMHQSGMLRSMVDEIKTPLLLYVEQDTPLTPDCEIDWRGLSNQIVNGTSNLIRFHFEAHIPKEHEHMMLGEEPEDVTNIPLIRTAQWSQRPHLASVAYYKRILSEYFTDESKSFIEDNMHGVVHRAFTDDGVMGWNQHRIHIYNPEGNIKRSYHIDGREGEKKYDESQVF